ncbi:NAD(P)H-quinone oxidoreductase [Oleisolibacter albus]|uniref:NAD(P)H-quinone oxidoreductase n=1 Tax=Oleisolibacter albus TaxID=2171757 RepID=UPI000DF2C555|nr:NAD(P)H-quinone oxidoreductase [Oleisolibacter albus]
MTLPETMRAVEIRSPGGPEVLTPVRRPLPQPGAGELLIRVAAAGVNRPDVFQRQGTYPPPPGASDLPGLEVAGTVAALGAGVQGWAVGDPVCALLAGGGYAEYAAAPAPQCLPVPAGLSLEEAAALPETCFTVWTNVVERGGLRAGDSFLVHGGTSGIGSTAIQLAKARGATVFATAGGPEKVEACRRFGADHAIDYRAEDFVAVVKQATGGRGVDVILDMVGGDYVARNIEALAVEGRHVSIAFLQGAKVALNLMPVMLKRLTLTGSTLRARSVAQKGALAEALRREVWPLIEQGRLRPHIHARFPLEQAAAAHALMESSSHVGKIVLTL